MADMTTSGWGNNYYQSYPNNLTAPQSSQNLIFVRGIEEAKSFGFGLAPNSRIALWDSNDQVFYVVSKDATGKMDITVGDFTIRDKAPDPQISELDSIKSELTALREDLKSMKEMWR